jgi:hypothetical protein
MSVVPSYGVRTLLIGMAICAVVLGALSWVGRTKINADHVIERVESLNGAVGVDYPPTEIDFSVSGLTSLIQDSDLQQMAPYLTKLDLQTVALVNTKITDIGFRSLIDACSDTLRHVNTSGSSLGVKSLKSLTECQNLESIALSVGLLTTAGIREISSIKSLRQIYIYDTHPDDIAVEQLKESLRKDVNVYTYRKPNTFSL